MIDLDRGVSMRTHPKRFRVCMYKTEPGVFYDANGVEIDPSLAQEAGFDVAKLQKERKKIQAMEKARKKVEQEFAERTDEMDAVMKAENPEVKHVAFGKYAIFEGKDRVTDLMTKEQANELLEARNGET